MTKKILLVCLAFVLIFALYSCKKDEPIPSDEPILGGFTDVEDDTITDELLEIFNSAQASWEGIHMEPVKLLQTQVVAGTNYKFLATQSIILFGDSEPTVKEVVATIYKDLDGNTTVLDVVDYEGETN